MPTTFVQPNSLASLVGTYLTIDYPSIGIDQYLGMITAVVPLMSTEADKPKLKLVIDPTPAAPPTLKDTPPPTPPSPGFTLGNLDKSNEKRQQVDGTHYAMMSIEPVDYALANQLNCLQFCMVKHASRYPNKGEAVTDLKKVIDYAQIALKRQFGVDSTITYAS